MNEQLDWYCMRCHGRMEQKFPTCPICQGNHTVFLKPLEEAPPPPPTLGIHVVEKLGAKATPGGSK